MFIFKKKSHNNYGDGMKDIIEVIIKGVISLIFLFFVIKILGKKQISQLNIFDYVIGISLGNIAAEMTINEDITILEGFLAMSIYGFCSLFVSYITIKSIHARRFISGVPIVLIDHGKISKEQLKKVKLDINDLIQDAREDGIFDISEVNYAIMEVSGKVTFLLKSEYDTPSKKDLNIKEKDKGLCANLILDGNIMYENLKNFGKDEKWLQEILLKYHKKLEDIFLLTCNENEEIKIFDMNTNFDYNILE